MNFNRAVSRLPDERMVWIPGGSFRMGSEDFYPEERPVHTVAVEGFWMDPFPVTNAEFARFTAETGYRTTAEQPPDPAVYPDIEPTLLVPGSLVFRQARGRVPLNDPRRWWAYVPGANWRNPKGPGSDLAGLADHPVVHVTFADAAAYAAWAGKSLPSEAEWEFAARGRLEGAVFVWGDEFQPDGQFLANTWQGEFPWQNLASDGYAGTSPMGSFPPNGYGLYDMAGNVWEWTVDLYTLHHPGERMRPCCAPANLGDQMSEGKKTVTAIPRRVVKGGSHLCAPNYCLRYRPAARQGESVDTSTGHIGFRCVARGPK